MKYDSIEGLESSIVDTLKDNKIIIQESETFEINVLLSGKVQMQLDKVQTQKYYYNIRIVVVHSEIVVKIKK